MTWPEFELLMLDAGQETLPESLLNHQRAGEGLNPYYNLLRRLAIDYKTPGIFLEIGCYHGSVAEHVADANREREKLGVPPHLYLGVDINEVPFAGDPNCSFIMSDSNDPMVAEQVRHLAENFGGVFCVFQDSSHHYIASVREWELYSPLVRPGGVWLADDITPAFQRPGLDEKSMVGYWDDLVGEKKVYDNLHIGSKIGVMLL